jgi:hypothetical protein
MTFLCDGHLKNLSQIYKKVLYWFDPIIICTVLIYFFVNNMDVFLFHNFTLRYYWVNKVSSSLIKCYFTFPSMFPILVPFWNLQRQEIFLHLA